MLTLRPATNSDCAHVQELVFGVLREFGLVPDPVGHDADIADIEASYLRPGGMFEVVEGTGGNPEQKIVGSTGLFPFPDRPGVCELRKMYLLPEYRGQGWGRKLMLRSVDAARELGFSRIELETSRALTDAIAMYRKYGFADIEREKLAARCEITMALDLE